MTKQLHSITLKSDSQELHEAVLQLMLAAKPQLVANLTQLLNSKGVSSDLTMKVTDNIITFSGKSVDKGLVCIVENGLPVVQKYTDIEVGDIYFVLSEGHFKLFLKHKSGVDKHISGYTSFEDIVVGASSDEVRTAIKNLTAETVVEDAEIIEETPKMSVVKGEADVTE